MTKQEFLNSIGNRRNFNYLEERVKGHPVTRIIFIYPPWLSEYTVKINGWYDEMKFKEDDISNDHLNARVYSSNYDNYGDVISEHTIYFKNLYPMKTKEEKTILLQRLIDDPRSTKGEVILYQETINKLISQ